MRRCERAQSLLRREARPCENHFFAGLIDEALQEWSREKLLSPGFFIVPWLWERDTFSPKTVDIALGSFNYTEPPEIRGEQSCIVWRRRCGYSTTPRISALVRCGRLIRAAPPQPNAEGGSCYA